MLCRISQKAFVAQIQAISTVKVALDERVCSLYDYMQRTPCQHFVPPVHKHVCVYERLHTCSIVRALHCCNTKQQTTSQKQQQRCEIYCLVAYKNIWQNCMPSHDYYGTLFILTLLTLSIFTHASVPWSGVIEPMCHQVGQVEAK